MLCLLCSDLPDLPLHLPVRQGVILEQLQRGLYLRLAILECATRGRNVPGAVFQHPEDPKSDRGTFPNLETLLDLVHGCATGGVAKVLAALLLCFACQPARRASSGFLVPALGADDGQQSEHHDSTGLHDVSSYKSTNLELGTKLATC